MENGRPGRAGIVLRESNSQLMQNDSPFNSFNLSRVFMPSIPELQLSSSPERAIMS